MVRVWLPRAFTAVVRKSYPPEKLAALPSIVTVDDRPLLPQVWEA